MDLNSYIANAAFVKQFIGWLKRVCIPGLRGVPLYSVLEFLYIELFFNAPLTMRANAIAYSFFMSIFPAFIVLFSVIPYLPFNKEDLLSQIHVTILEVMPNKTGDTLFEAIHGLIKTKRSDALSFGSILAIYFSSSGVMTLMNGFQKKDDAFEQRGYWQQLRTAIGITLMLSFMLTISSVLVILGTQIFGWVLKILKLSTISAFIFLAIKWLVVVGALYLGIAILYRFGISTKRKIPYYSPGANVATVLSLLTSLGFSFYVDNFSNYNKVYGSFVAGIVLLIWLQLNAMILIIGFELNAAIEIFDKKNVKPVSEVAKQLPTN